MPQSDGLAIFFQPGRLDGKLVDRAGIAARLLDLLFPELVVGLPFGRSAVAAGDDAVVMNDQVTGKPREPLPLHGRLHHLVDRPLVADARVVPEQPHLLAGEPARGRFFRSVRAVVGGPSLEVHVRRIIPRGHEPAGRVLPASGMLQEIPELQAVGRRDRLVGVQNKNPVAGRLRQGGVSRFGEIVVPRGVKDLRAENRRDRPSCGPSSPCRRR